MIKQISIFLISLFFLASCTISPTSKQYCVESDFFNGEMVVHEGPGVKDAFNVLDDATYYDKVSGYSFSSNLDEGEAIDQSIEIRFANNGIAYLSGHTDYRLPMGDKKDLMTDIDENYGSEQSVEQQLIRQSLENGAFTAGQFMNVFDALSKNRSYLKELIYDQANNGQYQVMSTERKVIDVTTGKEKTIRVSDRITCIDSLGNNPLCIGGYLRTEESPLRLYGIKLFNFTVKSLKGEESIEKAIAANLGRSNKMEELAIQAKQAQVDAATTIEKSKADVATKEAETAIAVAEAQKQTAVKVEKVKQAKLDAEAELAREKVKAEAARLKVAAGLSPLKKAEIDRDKAIGVAEAWAKRPVPMVNSSGQGLEETANMKELLLLIKSLDGLKKN
jgi:regulator of protease activity HflC (stomatin/prohibitin superfamily)